MVGGGVTRTNAYLREVKRSHRKYLIALKKAKTRQQMLNAYWKHKRHHENILRRHLREELNEAKRLKLKIT